MFPYNPLLPIISTIGGQRIVAIYQKFVINICRNFVNIMHFLFTTHDVKIIERDTKYY